MPKVKYPLPFPRLTLCFDDKEGEGNFYYKRCFIHRKDQKFAILLDVQQKSIKDKKGG